MACYCFTAGKDVFDAVLSVLVEYILGLKELHGVTTDGAASMTGRLNGFTALLMKEVEKVKLKDDVIISHCIIHQENLCAKVLSMDHVMQELSGHYRELHQVSRIEPLAIPGSSVGVKCGSRRCHLYFSSIRWLS